MNLCRAQSHPPDDDLYRDALRRHRRTLRDHEPLASRDCEPAPRWLALVLLTLVVASGIVAARGLFALWGDVAAMIGGL